MREREEGEQREEADNSKIREDPDVDDSLDRVAAGRAVIVPAANAATSTLPPFLYCSSDSCSCASSPCSKIDDVMPCPSPCEPSLSQASPYPTAVTSPYPHMHRPCASDAVRTVVYFKC